MVFSSIARYNPIYEHSEVSIENKQSMTAAVTDNSRTFALRRANSQEEAHSHFLWLTSTAGIHADSGSLPKDD